MDWAGAITLVLGIQLARTVVLSRRFLALVLALWSTALHDHCRDANLRSSQVEAVVRPPCTVR